MDGGRRSGEASYGDGEDDETVRVVLIDGEAVIRAGLAMLLESEPDISVVGEASDGHAAIALVSGLKPDVVVLDIRMPGADGGLTAARSLAAGKPADGRRPPVPVLILTACQEDAAVRDALEAGASGFLLTSSAPPELAAAVRALARGGGWVNPSPARPQRSEYMDGPEAPPVTAPEFPALTNREREVLAAVAHGMSNAQIAQELFLSEGTVKTHVHRILMKLGVAGRAQAVVAAFRSGLVKPDGL